MMAFSVFVEIDATLSMVAQSSRCTGRIVMLGIGGGVMPFLYNAPPQGCSLMAVLGATREQAEVVVLAVAGKVKPHIQRFLPKKWTLVTLTAGKRDSRASYVNTLAFKSCYRDTTI